MLGSGVSVVSFIGNFNDRWVLARYHVMTYSCIYRVRSKTSIVDHVNLTAQ